MSTARLSFPRALLLALLVVASSSSSRADEVAADLDPDTEVARRHFRAGSAAYEQGDYRTALDELERARLARPLPDFDYNIGRCLDRLERWADAVAAYQRFADATSDARERAEVRARIDVLRARLQKLDAAHGATTAPPQTLAPTAALATTPAPPRAEAGRAYRGPVIVGAVGLAALAVGLGLYGSVGGDYDALQRSCAPGCAPSRWSGLQMRERAGLGLVIAGGAVAVVDIAYWAVLLHRRAHAAPLSPLPATDVAVAVRP